MKLQINFGNQNFGKVHDHKLTYVFLVAYFKRLVLKGMFWVFNCCSCEKADF